MKKTNRRRLIARSLVDGNEEEAVFDGAWMRVTLCGALEIHADKPKVGGHPDTWPIIMLFAPGYWVSCRQVSP